MIVPFTLDILHMGCTMLAMRGLSTKLGSRLRPAGAAILW